MAGCQKYDDSALSGRVDQLEDRVSALEDRIDEFQNSIDEFTELINQYKNEARIKDFTETSDGYLLTFADGRQMHIRHGEIPDLSVVFDAELKEYVWTANGEVILDKEGNPVPAYIAPEFEVRDGKLGYTLGNEWHEVSNGETVGLISDVVETSEGVSFILSSGSVINIPKVGFRLNIDYFEYGAKPGQTVQIDYTITDKDANAELLVYPDDGFTVVNTGYNLEVTLPEDETLAYSGKVLAVAVNGNGATSAKIIRFGALVTEVTSAEVVKINRKGGLVPINIRSNRPYSVMPMPDPETFIPPDWLVPSEGPATKAAREDVVYYEVLPMPDDMTEDRTATLQVEWQTNIKQEQEDWENFEKYTIRKEIVITQLDTKDVAVDRPMDNNGNPYPADSGKGLLEGKLEGGWTFRNCAVVELEYNSPEVRLGLNGLNEIEDGHGSLTSPVFNDGIGIFCLKYGSITGPNRWQHIKFKVQCLKADDNSVLYEKEVTQAKTLLAPSVINEETFEIDQNVPCRIVVTNVSTMSEGKDYNLATYNFMKIYSAYYTAYKAK